MTTAPPSQTCFHHTDRDAGRHCTRCGRPACSECLHQASVGSHCWECIKAAQPPKTEQIKRQFRAMDAPFSTIMVGLNVAVFAFTQGGYGERGQRLTEDLAVFKPAVADGEWYRLFTSGFIHYGALHLLFNMLILHRLCGMFESQLGSWRIAGVYFAALFAGSFGAVLIDPFYSAGGGASGAILGVMAAIGVAMWHRGVSFWQTGFGPYLVIILVMSVFQEGVSLGAHLGGAIGGAAVGWFFFNQYEPRRKSVAATGWVAVVIVSTVSIVGSVLVSEQKVDRETDRLCAEIPAAVRPAECLDR